MKIVFDLLHPADINLFKNLIFRLDSQGHTIYIIYRERGVLGKIIKAELSSFDSICIGQHKKGFLSKLFGAITRDLKCFPFLRREKIDLVVCQGIACGLSSKLLGIKIIHFDDDSEYRLTYLLGKYFADVDVIPNFMNVTGNNFARFNGYKELAYLHPSVFIPNLEALSAYNLEQSKYVFIREISNISLNYQQRVTVFDNIINILIKRGIKIVLSMEDKKLASKYKDSTILLNEPVDNLHSLMYFARFMISAGDTMAREAALMGVPCIYTGGREMKANELFIKIGLLYKSEEIYKIEEIITKLLDVIDFVALKKLINDVIVSELDDTTDILYNQVIKFDTNLFPIKP